MIYFVDEDVRYLEAFVVELECRGHKVRVLDDADVGFKELTGAADIDIALIDIMLAVEQDPHKSRYKIESEEEELTTGLAFLDDLVVQRPDVFPQKAAVLTCAREPWLVTRIKHVCGKHKIPLLNKDNFASSLEFAEQIEEIIQSYPGAKA